MHRRTLPLAKPAAKAMDAAAAAASGEPRQLSETLRAGGVAVGGALAKIKGTVMEAMARRMPEQDRVFLAERWGFSNAGNTVSAEHEVSAPAQVEPAAEQVVAMAAPVVLSAEQETLAKARAAGAAARRAMEVGPVSVRLDTNGATAISGNGKERKQENSKMNATVVGVAVGQAERQYGYAVTGAEAIQVGSLGGVKKKFWAVRLV